MSIRTTVTLDEDVLARVQQESRAKGQPFGRTLNEVLRRGLVATQVPSRACFKIEPVDLGYHSGLNYDDVESLIEFGEGAEHR